ncbi:MAG TPA: hypothetical protein VHA11_03980 [Bryobacteraceae bacterium]|nr:hypothetical protein [Bryobacteraceae bacterium]
MLLSMADVATWNPMHWPGLWSDPSQLALLDATPFNCLVLRWGPRKHAPAFLDAARSRGLALVGLIEGEGRAEALRSAGSAHLDAVALDQPAETGLPVIAWGEKSKLAWKSAAAGFAIADGVWPGIPKRESAESGPTGAPWVDSNGWQVQLARTLAGGKPVWLNAAPPAEGIVRSEAYTLAVADSAAYGARWIVALHDKLAAAIAAGDSKALATWRSMAAATKFFDTHRAWSALPCYANVAVLSDFAGPNEYVAQELLNLLPRRGVSYRILEKGQAEAASFDGLACILYPDQDPPPADLQRKLQAFLEQGGVLLAHNKWPAPAGAAPTPDTFRRWNIYAVGKGRLAIAAEEGIDPYEMAADTQLILGHRNDIARYFNFATLNGYYTAAENRAVLHLLNFALRAAGHPVSVTLMRNYRGARLWRPDGAGSANVELARLPAGVELHLPPLGVYAAIELEL